MQYAIDTLEIQIAHLKETKRKMETSIFTDDDSRGGHFPSWLDIDREIKELELAVSVLKEYDIAHPKTPPEIYE